MYPCASCTTWYDTPDEGNTRGHCAACAPPNEIDEIRRIFGADLEVSDDVSS